MVRKGYQEKLRAEAETRLIQSLIEERALQEELKKYEKKPKGETMIEIRMADGSTIEINCKDEFEAGQEYAGIKDLLQHGHDRKEYWYDHPQQGVLIKVKDISAVLRK